MDAVRARGELGGTVVVFTSDNGLAFGEHRWTKKSCPYQACLGVPFMIRMPGVPHRTERAIVSAADLAPTIAELTGASTPTDFDGVSLVPLLSTGSREGLPGEVFAEWVGDRAIPAWWEVRTRRFAYIELGTGERELYALRDDPYELVNVVDAPAFQARRLAARRDARGVPERVRHVAAVALGAILLVAPVAAGVPASAATRSGVGGSGDRDAARHRPDRDRRPALGHPVGDADPVGAARRRGA